MDIFTIGNAVIRQKTDFLDAAFAVSEEMMKCTHGPMGYTWLHFAAGHSTERMVQYFLDQGFPVDARTKANGQTALHAAVMHCNLGTAKLLLEQGCPVYARDSTNRTALDYAMTKGTMRLHAHSSSGWWSKERSAAHFSSTDNYEIISELLRHGANVNVHSTKETPPLFRAIEHGAASLVRLFLQYGANVHDCRKGYSALHYAATKSSKDIVEMLLDTGAEVNRVTEKKGRTALHLAAASARNDEIVDLLIKRGAMVNAKDREGETPILMAMAKDDSIDLYQRHVPFNDSNEIPGDLDFNDFILYNSSNFEYPRNLISLTKEEAERRHQMVRSLLNAGARLDDRNNRDEPPLHRALVGGIEPVIKLVLELGADVRYKTSGGWSALHAAVRYAPVSVTEMLINRDVPVDEKIPYIGATALHIAVFFQKVEQMELLIARGAAINVTDNIGSSPLHYAARLFASSDISTTRNIVDILLENGADPLARSLDNKSPLDLAVKSKCIQLIEALLRHMTLLEAAGDPRASKVMTFRRKRKRCRKVYKKCQRELVQLKEETIYENVSYYDVILATHRDPKDLLENDEFVKAYKNNQTIKKLYFYKLTSKKFDDALMKKEMFAKAAEYPAALLRHAKLPISIIEAILNNYEPNDIEKFVKDVKDHDAKLKNRKRKRDWEEEAV